MIRYFKYAMIAIIGLIATVAIAQQFQHKLYGKPVPCLEDGPADELVLGFYELGLQPLLGFIGTTYSQEGFPFPSEYYIMYNMNDYQITILERMQNGTVCVITGASKFPVEFDTDKLNQAILGEYKDEL